VQFNLETHDDEALCTRLNRWRDQPLTPLVIELFFEAGTPDAPLPTLLERWSLAYHAELVAILEAPAVYKRVVLLCRTLVAQLLQLPAHSVVKQLRKHKLSPSRLSFQVKTHASPGVDFATPSRSFRFADIATPRGSVRLQVDYLPDCSAFRPAMPQSEQVLILNYDPSAASTASAGMVAASPPAVAVHTHGGVPRSQPLPLVASPPTHARPVDFVNSAPVAIPLSRLSGGSHAASVSPRSDTFLVGSYAYSASPQASPRSPPVLGFEPVDRQRSGSKGESMLLRMALAPAAPMATSLRSHSGRTTDDNSDEQRDDEHGGAAGGAATVGDEFDDTFEEELDALQLLTNSNNPFTAAGRAAAAADDDASASTGAGASSSGGVGDSTDSSAMALERFVSLCAATPRLALFEPTITLDETTRRRCHARAFDLLRDMVDVEPI
jgi:hypothetical protein